MDDKHDDVDELRRMATYFQSIVDNIPDVVFIKDAVELRYVLLNRAGEQFLGAARADIIGKTDYDLFPVEIAESYRAKDRETIRGGGVVEIPEERVPTSTGERFVHAKKIVLADESGTPKYMLGIGHDITARRKAELELEKLRVAVAAAVVHDLRSPLQSILFQLDVARTGNKNESRQAFDEIRRDVERLYRLTNDMLDWTRVAIDDVPLACEIVDLALVVPAIADRLSARIAGHPLEVRTQGPLPPVSVDPMRLEQILHNLLENAAKYGAPEKPICVDVENEATGVCIRVSDCGPGIDPVDLPRVFDRFFRSSSSAAVPGLGLGLYITKGLVRAHGGEISVTSELGHGSVFRVWIPAAS